MIYLPNEGQFIDFDKKLKKMTKNCLGMGVSENGKNN